MTSALKKAVSFAENTEKKQRNPIPFLDAAGPSRSITTERSLLSSSRILSPCASAIVCGESKWRCKALGCRLHRRRS